MPRTIHKKCNYFPNSKFPFTLNIFSPFQKNGTAEGVLKVVTGMREVAHVGQILSFNGKVKLDFWKGRCNDLK